MERIGIAASKIAKGNFFLYNLFVVIISFLFSLFVFVVAGSSILLALIIMAFLVSGIMPLEFENNWATIIRICMMTLTTLVGFFTLFAVLKNVRIRRTKD